LRLFGSLRRGEIRAFYLYACDAAEFDGYTVGFQMVANFFDPSETWVLAWGTVEGGNGRGISGQSTLYRVGTDEVKAVWDDGREVNVSAQKSLIGWEFDYANKEMLYGNDPKPYFLDVYELDLVKRTFSRAVHYRHSENCR